MSIRLLGSCEFAWIDDALINIKKDVTRKVHFVIFCFIFLLVFFFVFTDTRRCKRLLVWVTCQSSVRI